MKLGNFEIGKKVFILAEIGNNHNGNFQIAKELVIKAAKAGANGVKFQTFNPDLYVAKNFKIFSHVKGIHPTQYERLKSIQLSHSQYYELKSLADKHGIIFSSTPFDEDSADFLDEIVPFFKLASGDLTNLSLLKHIATKGKPVVLSTGMGNTSEIRRAINEFPKVSVILLHCVARYPTPIEEANVLSIPYLRDEFSIPVGYSDHTIGLTACKTAVSLGAVLIEKHFTLDKNQSTGDHKFSADPVDLAELVTQVRDVEKALGVYGKPIENQMEAIKRMRRSMYARVDIHAGTTITPDMIVALRPAGGLPPDELDNIVGKIAKVDIKKDTLISKKMF